MSDMYLLYIHIFVILYAIYYNKCKTILLNILLGAAPGPMTASEASPRKSAAKLPDLVKHPKKGQSQGQYD